MNKSNFKNSDALAPNQPQSDIPTGLSHSARRALAAAGIQRLEQLTKFSEAEVKQWHGIGPIAFSQLYRALEAGCLSFAEEGQTPSQLITNQILELADWRGTLLARLRELIFEAAPSLTEEWKWDTAVWSSKGNVVAVGAFKDHIKLNFFKGASLADPQGLFNAGLDAKTARAIDFYESDEVQEASLKDLISAAVAHNLSGNKKK